MNLITWGIETLEYAEEIILGISLILGAGGVMLVKARNLKNELLDVMRKSETDNEHFKKTAFNEGLEIAEKIIRKKLL